MQMQYIFFLSIIIFYQFKLERPILWTCSFGKLILLEKKTNYHHLPHMMNRVKAPRSNMLAAVGSVCICKQEVESDIDCVHLSITFSKGLVCIDVCTCVCVFEWILAASVCSCVVWMRLCLVCCVVWETQGRARVGGASLHPVFMSFLTNPWLSYFFLCIRIYDTYM